MDSRIYAVDCVGGKEFRNKTFDELCDIGKGLFEKLRVMSRCC